MANRRLRAPAAAASLFLASLTLLPAVGAHHNLVHDAREHVTPLVETSDDYLLMQARAIEGEVKGAIRMCDNSMGNPDVYVVQEDTMGSTEWGFVVMEGLLFGEVRVAYVNPIAQTYQGTNVEMTVRGHSWVTATQITVTGLCGVSAGYALSGDEYGIRIVHGGLDLTVTHSTGRLVSVTVEVSNSASFNIALDEWASFEIGWGASNTIAVEEGYSVTYHSTRKEVGGQTYTYTGLRGILGEG